MGIFDSIIKAGNILTKPDGPFTNYYEANNSWIEDNEHIPGHPLHPTNNPGVLVDNPDFKHERLRDIRICRIGNMLNGEWDGIIQTFFSEKRSPGKYPTVSQHEEYAYGKKHGVYKQYYSNKILKYSCREHEGNLLENSFGYHYDDYGRLIEKSQYYTAQAAATKWNSARNVTNIRDCPLIDDNPDKKYTGSIYDNY